MEKDSVLKSSKKQRHLILGMISQARAEALLADWANMRTDMAAIRLLLHNYPEIAVSGNEMVNVAMALKMRELLRSAWDARDLRQFEWRLWIALAFYLSAIVTLSRKDDPMMSVPAAALDVALEVQKDPPEVITAVEAALFYLRHNRARALFCPTPTCSNPYFFQKRKSQKYCSEECAYPSKAEAKRRWWANNKSPKERTH